MGCNGGGGGGTGDAEPGDAVSEDVLPDDAPDDTAGEPDAPDAAADPEDVREEDDAGPVTTYPDNILVNGGFEYGLQCYANWVWSRSGVDYEDEGAFDCL